MNAIHAIHPYRHEGLWVFDDEAMGLWQEPFVAGADAILVWMGDPAVFEPLGAGPVSAHPSTGASGGPRSWPGEDSVSRVQSVAVAEGFPIMIAALDHHHDHGSWSRITKWGRGEGCRGTTTSVTGARGHRGGIPPALQPRRDADTGPVRWRGTSRLRPPGLLGQPGPVPSPSGMRSDM